MLLAYSGFGRLILNHHCILTTLIQALLTQFPAGKFLLVRLPLPVCFQTQRHQSTSNSSDFELRYSPPAEERVCSPGRPAIFHNSALSVLFSFLFPSPSSTNQTLLILLLFVPSSLTIPSIAITAIIFIVWDGCSLHTAQLSSVLIDASCSSSAGRPTGPFL